MKKKTRNVLFNVNYVYRKVSPTSRVTSIHSEVHTWICISDQVMFVIFQIHHHTLFSYNCLTKEKPSKDISFYKPNLPLKRNPHIIDILLSIKIQ
jgi:hypothetical protein